MNRFQHVQIGSFTVPSRFDTVEIGRLAANQGRRTRRMAQHAATSGRNRGRVNFAGKYFECPSQQRIANKDCDGLTKQLVAGRSTAAKIVIVHRW
jgi:hypothetical protein